MIHGPPRFIGPNHFLVLSTQAIYLWNVHKTEHTWVDVLKAEGLPDRRKGFEEIDVEMVSKLHARMAVWNHIGEDTEE